MSVPYPRESIEVVFDAASGDSRVSVRQASALLTRVEIGNICGAHSLVTFHGCGSAQESRAFSDDFASDATLIEPPHQNCVGQHFIVSTLLETTCAYALRVDACSLNGNRNTVL